MCAPFAKSEQLRKKAQLECSRGDLQLTFEQVHSPGSSGRLGSRPGADRVTQAAAPRRPRPGGPCVTVTVTRTCGHGHGPAVTARVASGGPAGAAAAGATGTQSPSESGWQPATATANLVHVAWKQG